MFASTKTDDSELSLPTLNFDLEKVNHDQLQWPATYKTSAPVP
jgi:hypothetical protein